MQTPNVRLHLNRNHLFRVFPPLSLLASSLVRGGGGGGGCGGVGGDGGGGGVGGGGHLYGQGMGHGHNGGHQGTVLFKFVSNSPPSLKKVYAVICIWKGSFA